MTGVNWLVRLAVFGIVAACLGALASSSPATPLFAAGRVNLTFTPQDGKFEEAAEEYRRLWASEGATIVDAMERVSGLTFVETDIKAVIFEGASQSGFGNTPMYLRASYPAEVKRATLVHETGHRLNSQLRTRPKDLDEHRMLFLYLYDAWESLWGKAFADQQVTIESGRKGLYDYETAWKWALSISKEERASRFAEIVKANRR
jgi:hypothetical protein